MSEGAVKKAISSEVAMMNDIESILGDHGLQIQKSEQLFKSSYDYVNKIIEQLKLRDDVETLRKNTVTNTKKSSYYQRNNEKDVNGSINRHTLKMLKSETAYAKDKLEKQKLKLRKDFCTLQVSTAEHGTFGANAAVNLVDELGAYAKESYKIMKAEQAISLQLN